LAEATPSVSDWSDERLAMTRPVGRGMPARFAVSALLPRAVQLLLLRRAARNGRQRLLREERLLAHAVAGVSLRSDSAGPVHLVDGYHGSVTFWDWIALKRGGLWYEFLWPLVFETVLERLRADPRLCAVLELDGHTFEEMAEKAPAAVAQIRELLATGRLELVNGTYAQPLARTVSGEANIRHLHYGLAAVDAVLGTRVRSYLAGEPQFYPQLPQILSGFGYAGALFRTHWAAFGSDPAHDSSLLTWKGPDGSELRIVPRYEFMDYGLRGTGYQGLANGGLLGSDLESWDNRMIGLFHDEARRRGITRPLLSRLADPNPAEAPLPAASALAARPDIRFVTPKDYFEAEKDGAHRVTYRAADMPAAIPWGLGGGRLQRDIADGEGALLLAERLDALAYAMGRRSEEAKLDDAWKEILHSQHHDFFLCGPWLSRKHKRPMAEVAQDMAVSARRSAEQVAQEAAAYLASQVDSSTVQGRALILFNPSSWSREDYFEVAVAGKTPAVYREDAEVPSQVVQRIGKKSILGFVAKLPPLGYTLYDIREGQVPSLPPTEPPSERPGGGLRFFSNPFFSLYLNPNGSIQLQTGEKTVLEGGHVGFWKKGKYYDSRQSKARIELFQQGPVFERYRLTGRLAKVDFCQWITLYRTLPRIDFRVEFDFGEGSTFGPQLSDSTVEAPYYLQDERKLCFNLASPLDRLFGDSPFCIEEIGEGRTIALSMLTLEDGLGNGVAVLNRGTPGYHFDRRTGLLQNVLAWAPERWPYASDDYVTAGSSRFTRLRGGYAYECSLIPFSSRLSALRASADYRLPCLGVVLSPRSASLPSYGTFLRLEPEQVVLSSLFVQKERVYARLWNPSDADRKASIESGGPLSLWDCSLDLSSQSPAGAVTLPGWGVRTLRLGGPASQP
jgi:hypothetical protein